VREFGKSVKRELLVVERTLWREKASDVRAVGAGSSAMSTTHDSAERILNHVALQLDVDGTINLAHATCAERCGDLKRPQLRTWSEGYKWRDYIYIKTTLSAGQG